MSIHNNYSKLNAKEKCTVDETFEAVQHSLECNEIRCALDDTAEHLVEAIATYVIESKSRM